LVGITVDKGVAFGVTTVYKGGDFGWDYCI
jgi:hypothetical protein